MGVTRSCCARPPQVGRRELLATDSCASSTSSPGRSCAWRPPSRCVHQEARMCSPCSLCSLTTAHSPLPTCGVQPSVTTSKGSRQAWGCRPKYTVGQACYTPTPIRSGPSPSLSEPDIGAQLAQFSQAVRAFYDSWPRDQRFEVTCRGVVQSQSLHIARAILSSSLLRSGPIAC